MSFLRQGCLLAALLGAASLLLCSCNDDEEESFYKTFAEMECSGPIAAGWIPVWVPRAASEIHEKHDLSSNRSILVFKCDAGRLHESIPKEMHPDLPDKMTEPGSVKASWFPEKVLAKDFKYYSCEEVMTASGKAHLAVAENEGVAFFWRP